MVGPGLRFRERVDDVPFLAFERVGELPAELVGVWEPFVFGSLENRLAFGGEAVFGGMFGAIILWGVRRAIYSSGSGSGSGSGVAP